MSKENKCPICNGTGYCVDMPCPECATIGFQRLLDLITELSIVCDKINDEMDRVGEEE